MSQRGKLGIVLSGGGARGAYQAGVIKGLAEIAARNGKETQTSMSETTPFPIITGVSAGAVNAAFMAADPGDFFESAHRLVESWQKITAEQVFKTDALTAGRLGFKFAIDAAMGAFYKKKMARSLLDTSPLQKFLIDSTPFENIEKNLANGKFEAVAISAMNYTNSHSLTFVQSQKPMELWSRSRRRAVNAKLGVEHVMASGAIPLFFPPIKVGDDHFGDGCLRNTAPLSPAIHLGADRIIVISVRRPDHLAVPLEGSIEPSIARVLGVVLNALLMDAIEFDMERLERINHTVDLIPLATRQHLQLRKVESLWIRPSQDIGALASQNFSRLPSVLRYLVGGLGSQKESSELTSYLLFDPDFCSQLTEMGRKDALAQEEAVTRFLQKP